MNGQTLYTQKLVEMLNELDVQWSCTEIRATGEKVLHLFAQDPDQGTVTIRVGPGPTRESGVWKIDLG
jgi:hypothetical protein